MEGRISGKVLEEIGDDSRLDLQVREDTLRILEERYELGPLKAMSRMVLRPPEFRSMDSAGARRLSMAALDRIQRLYADGAVDGTSPDYFFPAMLEEGVFFGVFENEELVSAAGTHVAAIDEGIAAVGNIYTRRDRRGRGYGGAARY